MISKFHSTLPSNHRRAFTRIELIIIVAVVVVLSAVVALPFIAKSHVSRCRLACISNVKQLGVAHRLFANDNDGLPVCRSTSGWPNGSNYVAGQSRLIEAYLILGNEISSPRVLLCPVEGDSRSRQLVSGSMSNLTDTAISYFLGIDAGELQARMILTGDRNLCGDLQGATLFPADGIRTNVLKTTASWHASTIHKGGGNIGFGDGSAEQINTKGLLAFLAKTGDSNNTVLLPKP